MGNNNPNFVPKITKEEFDRIKPRCNCPCNQLISWKEWYKYDGIPKFIKGHGKRKNIIVITKEEFEATGPHYCECSDNCYELIVWEDWYKTRGIPKYKRGHNLSDLSEESSAKKSNSLSNSKTGIKRPEFSGINHPNYGKHLVAWNKDKTLSDEHCKHLSESHIGNKQLQETIEKISNSMKGKYCGSKSSNWQGGISYLPYCFKFNDYLKEAVRDRDSRLCQLCSKDEKQNGNKNTVHHIHYDKDNCEPDLITLCNSCNAKVNYNRDYYENLFMNKLNERQLLFWTREYFINERLYYMFRFLFK